MGEREEALLNDIQEEDVIREYKSSEKERHYISCLPKMYWLFYRKPLWFLIFIPSLFSGVTSILSNYFMGKIIDALNADDPIPLINRYSLAMFICASVCSLFVATANAGWMRIGSLIGIKAKSILFKSMMHKDVTFFDTKSLGELIVLLNEDAKTVGDAFSFSKVMQIRCLGQLCSTLSVAIGIDWRLAAFSFMSILSIGILMRALKNYARKHQKARFKVMATAITIVSQAISNPRVIQAYGRQDYESARFFKANNYAADHSRTADTFFRVGMEGGRTLDQATTSIILSLGGFMIMRNRMTAGSLFALIRACQMLGMQINMLLGTANRELTCIEAGRRVWEVIDSEPAVDPDRGLVIPEKDFKGDIEFRNVWFKYPTRDVWVLKDVSFKIGAGDIAAMVGHSGSGKSTIVQLLLRFYDVNDGSILLDGRNIKEYSPHFIHSVVGVVQQYPALFTLSIRENILYGIPNMDRPQSEVENAAKVANAHNFIMKLPHGYDSVVGEKGTLLSGGQQQRIAIARAVLRDPAVLVTDEATAALDSQSERKVQDALDAVMKGRTSIIIAHRLGTIRAAKTIFVFDAGSLVEMGSHEELIERGEVYYSLVRRQMEKKEPSSISSLGNLSEYK